MLHFRTFNSEHFDRRFCDLPLRNLREFCKASSRVSSVRFDGCTCVLLNFALEFNGELVRWTSGWGWEFLWLFLSMSRDVRFCLNACRSDWTRLVASLLSAYVTPTWKLANFWGSRWVEWACRRLSESQSRWWVSLWDSPKTWILVTLKWWSTWVHDRPLSELARERDEND